MKKIGFRTPKNYDGTATTSHQVSELLRNVLAKIGGVCENRPDIILEAWPSIIGPRLSSMTQAISCVDGVLVVKVKNSTLHSLLSRNEKFRILSAIKQQFPKAGIENIIFKIG